MSKIIENIELKFHRCNDADFDQFWDPISQQTVIINMAKERKTMFCIDEDQDMKIFGNDRDNQRFLSLSYLPCSPNIAEKSCLNLTKTDLV